MLPTQGLDDESNRVQVVSDVWKDHVVLHKLQQGTFSIPISTLEQDRIGHQATRFHWESGLLFLMWPNGPRFVVPRPNQRALLV